jgi:hypothetical protein
MIAPFKLLLLSFFISLSALATQESPQSFNFQGRLFNLAGTAPLEELVGLRFQIFDPSGTCLLYQETQNFDLTNTSGVFAVSVGSATGAAKRTAGTDPGLQMRNIFKNDTTVATRAAASPNCAAGYTPTAGDVRLLRITVTPTSTGTPEVLSPDQTINNVPQALVAETLQGLGPVDFVQKDPVYVTTAAIDMLFGSLLGGVVDATTLHTHDDRYVQLGDSSASDLGSGGFNTTGASSVGVGTNFTNTTMSIQTIANASVGMSIKAGAAGQTANLFQLLNSTGTVLSSFDKDGNLGIGTAPATDMKLTTNIGATPFLITTGNNIGFGNASSGWDMRMGGGTLSTWNQVLGISARGSGNNIMTFSTTDTGTLTERMRIDHQGNVGVGITPTVKLHIAGNVVTQPGYVRALQGTNAALWGANYSFGLQDNTGTADRFLPLQWLDGGGNKQAEIATKYRTGNIGDLFVTLRNNASSNTVMSMLGDTGAVGIGTPTPAALLNLYSTSGSVLRLEADQHTDINRINFVTVGGAYHNIQSDTQNGNFDFRAGDGGSGHRVRFFTDGTEKMRINNTGHVGIGTGSSNPSSRLTVTDSVGVTGSDSTPLVSLDTLWNTTGSPTILKLNATYTAAGANTSLMEAGLGGIANFRMLTNGHLMTDVDGNGQGGITVGYASGITFNSGVGSITQGSDPNVDPGLVFSTSWDYKAGHIFKRNGNFSTITSGTISGLQSYDTFNPTSGTATYRGMAIYPTVNQTGGANGVSRGLHIFPTLTAAADWRSIELSNNSGYGIYQTGASANNYFAGGVGVGTTSTWQKLTVNGNIIAGTGGAAKGVYAQGNDQAGNYLSAGIVGGVAGVDGPSSYVKFGSYLNAGLGEQSYIALTRGGRVGIGTTTPSYTLDAVGDIRTSGCLYYNASSIGTCVSDRKLKKEISPFTLGLDEVLGLNPVHFKYNGLGETPNDGKKQLGVIAQDVEKVAPSLVHKKKVKLHPKDKIETSVKSVDYGSFTFMIINSVKKLYSMIKHSEEKIISSEEEWKASELKLKNKIKQLEGKNTQLTEYLCQKDKTATFCNGVTQ